MGVTAEFLAQYSTSAAKRWMTSLCEATTMRKGHKGRDFKEEIVPVELPQKKGNHPSF